MKFRAFDLMNKKMIPHEKLFAMDCSNEYPFLALLKGYCETYMEPLKVEVMTSVGVFDDDQNEIYKDDIVFCNNEDGFCLYIVEFGEYEKMPEAVFNAYYLKPLKQFDFSYEVEHWNENDVPALDIIENYNPNQKNFLVIGNKHENPELLKV